MGFAVTGCTRTEHAEVLSPVPLVDLPTPVAAQALEELNERLGTHQRDLPKTVIRLLIVMRKNPRVDLLRDDALGDGVDIMNEAVDGQRTDLGHPHAGDTHDQVSNHHRPAAVGIDDGMMTDLSPLEEHESIPEHVVDVIAHHVLTVDERPTIGLDGDLPDNAEILERNSSCRHVFPP